MRIDDTRPVWLQLVEEFRLRIVSGQWAPGSRVPSVRELAADTGVNPNTVQRALAELDSQALTQTARTAGRYVTSDEAVVGAVRHAVAAQAAELYVATVTGLGLSRDEATALVTGRWDPDNQIERHES